MSVVSLFIQLIYKSFFLTENTVLRKTNLLIKIFFIATTTYTYIHSLDKPMLLIYVFTVLVALSLMDKGFDWVLSVVFLSTLPGIWFSLTTMIFAVFNNKYIDTYTPLTVFVRTIVLTHVIVFSYSIVNPLEIYNLLVKLGRGRISVAVLLLYRLIPLGLKYFTESLIISKLKKESIKNRIGPAVASIIETASFINEYCYYKIQQEPKHIINYSINKLYTIVLLIISIINLFITLNARTNYLQLC